jgi:hypothetical protein
VIIVTHYVVWDQVGGRLVRALCGLLIRRREHANQPTCPTCAKLLAERESAPGPA